LQYCAEFTLISRFTQHSFFQLFSFPQGSFPIYFLQLSTFILPSGFWFSKLSNFRWKTCAFFLWHNSSVRSVLPPSTTTISSTQLNESSDRVMRSSSLYVIIKALISILKRRNNLAICTEILNLRFLNPLFDRRTYSEQCFNQTS